MNSDEVHKHIAALIGPAIDTCITTEIGDDEGDRFHRYANAFAIWCSGELLAPCVAMMADVRTMAESPIETMLGIALVERAMVLQLESFAAGARSPVSSECLSLHVTPQHRVGAMRVDFGVTAMRRGASAVIGVECDGHDYHERTKEQARRDKRRDRVALATGLSVVRFTGSEINKDAAACAREVFDLVLSGLSKAERGV